MALIEVGDCVYDEEQLGLSRGYGGLDAVGREAFVNHMHIDSEDRESEAARVVGAWAAEMRARWPGRVFRIYRVVEADEVTVRFHMVRPGSHNCCEDGVEVVTVGSPDPEPGAATDDGA